MGTYINKGNAAFQNVLNDVFVDKSVLIEEINRTLNTQRMYSCVTRCRRFGKSLAAKMLCAYYDKSCDSRAMFEGLKIATLPTFEQHLNKYSVIYLDVTDFTTRYRNDSDIVKKLQQRVQKDLMKAFPQIEGEEGDDLMDTIVKIYENTSEKFIFIIDEWDAILREFDNNEAVADEYIDLCRRLFKGSDSDRVFSGIYITGILPIKKYNTQSALNNFREYSMVNPGNLAPYFGFTEEEVEKIANNHGANLEELKLWYDGYKIGSISSIYNPYSVMEAIFNGECGNYWQTTGAYDSVKTYIQMNFDGLKDDVVRMLAGESVGVNVTTFQNDMHVVNSKDDVLTVLIHLGYLAYNRTEKACYIPNKEVSEEMDNAVVATRWSKLSETIDNSRKLLESTLGGDEQAVAQAIDLAHDEHTSILSYNNENSLACVLSIAYIWAKNEYIIHREYATGKGFADLVMIPRRNVAKPAMVIELKYDDTADTAISQIRAKNYPQKLSEYTGDLLLVGISYSRKTKQHTCRIERSGNNV